MEIIGIGVSGQCPTSGFQDARSTIILATVTLETSVPRVITLVVAKFYKGKRPSSSSGCGKSTTDIEVRGTGVVRNQPYTRTDDP